MKLAAVRAEFFANGNNLQKACAYSDVPYATARDWLRKGLLDPDNLSLKIELAKTVTPETMIAMAENAAGLVIEGQKQVARTLHNASPRDASKISREQFDIHQLATGQATARVEFMSRDDLLREIENLKLNEGVIDAEVVEE